MMSDPAVGATGYIDPTLDNLGNAKVEIAAHTGDYMIRVLEYTAATADPPAAKALIQQQYDAIN